MGRKKTSRKTTGSAPSASSAQPRGGGGRRRAVVLLAAASLVVLAVVAAWYFRSAPASGGAIRHTGDQNVLLVTIDTWRADALGASGSGKVSTPNLDRLAALGTRFDFAHAQAVVTLPSHVSILTGLYPYQHGVHDNAGFRLASTPTLAAMLRPAGFATGAFVGSIALDSRFGLNNGFDTYDEHYGKANLNSGFTMAERRADAVVALAREWIGHQKGRWFAWVHLFDPHAPYDPPAPFKAEYADRPYYGEVAFTDAALAPLLDAARDPSGRPTLVIVTGDHGEGLGDHGEMTHGLFAYEATLRVPLIVSQVDRTTPAWGGSTNTAPGRASVSNLPARHVDLVPTILDALGLPLPAGLPGRTLLPGAPASDPDRPSYFEALSASFNRGWAPLTGVLAGREKLISLPLPELYDLAKDPSESVNQFDARPERRNVLEARLRLFDGPGSAAARSPESSAARERLQTLGYVTGDAPRKERYTENDDPKRLIAIDQEMHHAIELYERKQPQAAIPIYRQMIAERPTMEVAYTQLAMLQWELGQPADAIATLRQAVAAGAGSATVRTKLGTYLAESGDVRAAVPLLEAAASGDAGDVEALNALGIALGRAGRTREAIATFERILRVDPANAMAVENLGSMALAEGRWADAGRWFSKALESDPASTQAHNGLGVVEMKAGNRQAAIEHWRQAVARDPENFDALYNVATELVNQGRPDVARPYLEQFARTAPPAFYARDIARVRGLLARIGH